VPQALAAVEDDDPCAAGELEVPEAAVVDEPELEHAAAAARTSAPVTVAVSALRLLLIRVSL
jgi:hypothetical protein